jgi:hypothetical protein
MEKRTMANVWRGFVAVFAFSVAAAATHAQLLNGGFESGDGSGDADNWTQFNGATQTATNDPCCTPDPIRAHSGAYSLNTYGPYGANSDASGAYQDIGGPVVGQTYKLSGYVLNWSGSPMLTSSGAVGFAVAQIKFLDGSGTEIQTNESAYYGLNVVLPLDQWQAFQVLATTPANAATLRVFVLHVGQGANSGSAWWDDLAVNAVTGATSTNTATSQPGVQISWPTTAGNDYQVQSTTSLTPASWTSFGPVYPGLGITNQVSDVVGTSTSKFYQIIQVP